jgi:hypothetical protein
MKPQEAETIARLGTVHRQFGLVVDAETLFLSL